METKVTIVGAGAVGSTTAFALAQSGLARRIVLLDQFYEKAEAEALDIQHGSLFFPVVDLKPSIDPKSARNSNVIVITAGPRQKPGQSRIEMTEAAIAMMTSILPPLVKVAPKALFLIVANPVDILTFVAQKIAGLPLDQVFGSGTVLDTSRLRALLAQKTGVNSRNIHAYIAGEHGDSEVPLWSSATIGTTPLLDFQEFEGCPALTQELREEIYSEVVNAAYKVIAGKGATNYAIALALVDILRAILRDERRILPMSTRITGIYGVENVAMSMPFVVGRTGILQEINTPLSRDELMKLRQSGQILRETLASVGY
ncbi:MAG: L-lactate dehydrogenase [Bifidobacteriaceae bacterium]|jgi:L-lactate dehydrogenase|nr:L-lactate dehydrogenase [Bifidobacteriaceae bacterium]